MNAHLRDRLARWIAVLVVPLLALSPLPAPVYAQAGALSLAPEPVALSGPAAPPEQAALPAEPASPAVAGAACDPGGEPPAPGAPGQRVVLAPEDEISVAWDWGSTDYSPQNMTLNYDGTTNLVQTNLKHTGGSLSSVNINAAVVADLNGGVAADNKQELVTVFRDGSKRIGAVSSAAPGVEWYMQGDYWWGDNLGYLDVAAGNLDRDAYPPDDEVVISFRDDDADLNMVLLDGNAAGGIANAPGTTMGRWYDNGNARGDVEFNAVATGDFNGDGFDDEIVTVFEDSDDDLQYVILRYQNNALTRLHWSYWTCCGRGDVVDDSGYWSNTRSPMDVTTGDVDGDLRDEIIIGARVYDPSNGALQLIVLDPKVDTKSTASITDDVYSFDDKVWVDHPLEDYYAMAALSVSLSAADLDGDGVDEIAVAYMSENDTSDHDARYTRPYLVAYEYVPPADVAWRGCVAGNAPVACLQQTAGRWEGERVAIGSSEEGDANRIVTVDTGDVDADGRTEIVLSRIDIGNGDMLVHVFDAEAGIPATPRITYRFNSDQSGTNGVRDAWVAVGDRDGDAKYGTYTGVCTVRNEAQVLAVIHAPPFYNYGEKYPNAWETQAGFGMSVGLTQGGGKGSSASVGGTVETERDISSAFGKYGAAWAGTGPAMSRGWEVEYSVTHEVLTSTVNSQSFATWTPHEANLADPAGDAYFDAVGILETHYWCYQYTEPSLGKVDVCLPYPESNMAPANYPLSSWWATGPINPQGDLGLASRYANTWVPVGRNLARGLGAAAYQPSTYSSFSTADKAVDGNRNGDYFQQQVTHTGQMAQPYWEIDLGNKSADPHAGRQFVNGILLWNRTDMYPEKLKGAYVFTSVKPFTSTLASELINSSAFSYTQLSTTATPQRRTIIPVNRYARYVRVQLPASAGNTYLHLAEVEVYGMPATPPDWPKVEPLKDTPGAGKYRLTWRDGRTQDVPGQLLWTTGTASPIGVRAQAGSNSMATGKGDAYNFIAQGEVSSWKSVGLKVKGQKIAFSSGSSQTLSYSQSWEREITFSATVDPLGTAPSACEYDVKSYVWIQRDVSLDGTDQAFLVQDWWVPYLSGTCPTATAAGAEEPAAPAAPAGPTVAPMMPVIDSSTHPNQDAWGGSTATFTWGQPGGDAATGYRFALDHNETTVVPPYSPYPPATTTYTWEGLADGVWWLHVRAQGDGDQWSETAHRKFQVDANAPQVTLALDPPLPTGANGWYNTPVSAVIAAQAGEGAPLAAVEYSTDNATWLPYGDPVPFTTDTAGATVYARAADAAGNVSAPVSATFKIDTTPPDSKVAGGPGPGVLFADVVTGPQGNQALVLVGAFQDSLSGRAGMHVGVDSLGTNDPARMDWTSAKNISEIPGVQANWYFTATRELGAGNHAFFGQAQDGAGNVEAPYKIASVVWTPGAAPDVAGSSVSVSPTTVRPGEVADFTVTARNGGFQDAYVDITAVLPAGLSVLTETLPSGVTWTEATRTLTWPPELMWPGDWARYTFQARAAAGLPAGALESQFSFHAGWPNLAGIPAEDLALFQAQERTFTTQAAVAVDPALAADKDVTPPWATLARAASEAALGGQDVALAVSAAEDARWMFLREWTLDPAGGGWTIAASTGWLDFSPALGWTLSDGHGVKYVGVWVRDLAGNVSALDEGSLLFVNRWNGSQPLAAGERIQYRGNLQRGAYVIAEVTTVSGDPDLFGWWPGNGAVPNLFAHDDVGEGQKEYIGEESLHAGGRYLLEVAALAPSAYTLAFPGPTPDGAAAGAARAAAVNPLPQHPLSISDPLSAGVATSPDATLSLKFHLPLIFRGQ